MDEQLSQSVRARAALKISELRFHIEHVIRDSMASALHFLLTELHGAARLVLSQWRLER
jgi:hypothetical protein